MKITIISDAPAAPLYTPRVRFLNKTLLAAGHEVTWFTERFEDIPLEIRPDNLVEIDYYKGKNRLTKGLKSFLNDDKNRFFEREILLGAEHTDLVICSTFLTFGLRAAKALAKRDNAFLHVDLRDIVEQHPKNILSHPIFNLPIISGKYRRDNIRKRNEVLAVADTVSVVSKYHRELIGKINANTFTIYNGYDEMIFKPGKRKSRDWRFDMVYLGKWYGNDVQDINPLFKALQGLHDIDIRLTFYTATSMHENLRKIVSGYKIDDLVEIRGYVPNIEVPDVLRQSDVAIVLTSPKNKGDLFTKFFEALGCKVPVLCTPSDGGELSELIEQTRAGKALTEPAEIRQFIRDMYNDKLTIEPEGDEFSRQIQTARWMEIMKIR